MKREYPFWIDEHYPEWGRRYMDKVFDNLEGKQIEIDGRPINEIRVEEAGIYPILSEMLDEWGPFMSTKVTSVLAWPLDINAARLSKYIIEETSFIGPEHNVHIIDVSDAVRKIEPKFDRLTRHFVDVNVRGRFILYRDEETLLDYIRPQIEREETRKGVHITLLERLAPVWTP